MKTIKSRILVLCMLALTAASAWAGPVNINTADATTLARELSGVGEATARAIVAHREAHGRFENPDALLEVKGIGPRILERNRRNILVGKGKN